MKPGLAEVHTPFFMKLHSKLPAWYYVYGPKENHSNPSSGQHAILYDISWEFKVAVPFPQASSSLNLKEEGVFANSVAMLFNTHLTSTFVCQWIFHRLPIYYVSLLVSLPYQTLPPVASFPCFDPLSLKPSLMKWRIPSYLSVPMSP